ncbi:MAG: acylphosphatase [Beijerinckiaceae bacterium]
MPIEQRIVRVRIGGFVQGVGYRAWTQREAAALGLAGFVRNRRGGDVEAVFAGHSQAVAQMCAACWRGPRGAQVSRVDVEDTDRSALAEAGRAGGFHLLATV